MFEACGRRYYDQFVTEVSFSWLPCPRAKHPTKPEGVPGGSGGSKRGIRACYVSRVRQLSNSRYSGRAPQTHLRELVAKSSHGRPARSPTNVAGPPAIAFWACLSRRRHQGHACVEQQQCCFFQSGNVEKPNKVTATNKIANHALWTKARGINRPQNTPKTPSRRSVDAFDAPVQAISALNSAATRRLGLILAEMLRFAGLTAASHDGTASDAAATAS